MTPKPTRPNLRRARRLEILSTLVALCGAVPCFSGGIQYIPADLEHSGTTEDERIGQSVAGGSFQQDYLTWNSVAADWQLTGSLAGIWSDTVPLFVDGFESGSTQHWSSVTP